MSQGRKCYLAAVVLATAALGAVNAASSATGPDFQDAIAALQRGDSVTAEQKLRAELKLYPDEAEAMSLLGVALDNQKKFPEAEESHRQALAKLPASADVLRNYGNHFLLAGDPRGAQEIFLKAVALDPANGYANLQLGQIALKSGNGQEALKYFGQLPPQQMDAPNMAVLRLAALDLSGNRAEADALFSRLANATENDGAVSASLGLILVQSGQYSQAETFLTHALAGDPTNFDLLYQLGVVASRAGHNERAREVLENALRRQPQNVDVLYGLAFVYKSLRQSEQAVRLLSQAARIAPKRADVQELLAVATSDIRAFQDSVTAWERYVELKPDDDTGRRERGFAKANVKQADAGMADLEWYVGKHPNDATGWYELGVAQAVDDPENGLATLNKAVALEPEYVEARSARGSLEYQQGQAEAALADLEFAAGKRPDNAMILDRLGQTYLLVDRLPDALRALRKAAELAPGDAKTQLHVANALGQAGQTEESHAFMNRYRELGGAINVPARGVMDFLSLTPEQQHAAYQARLEKAVTDHPEDMTTEVLYLKFSIGDGKMDQAVATARKILSLKPSSIILADAGHAMLNAKQYAIAGTLLDAAATGGSSAGVDLDLAIVAFHQDGANAGLERLNRLPTSARGSEFYVAQAEMLDAAGKPDEAIAAIRLALKAEPDRVDLYWRAAVLMAKNHRTSDAITLLDQAAIALPKEAEIPVIRATMLELLGKTNEALRSLSDAQHRWPEAASVWSAEGIILAAHQKFEEARHTLETATSLGAHSPEVASALAASSASGDRGIVDPAKLFLTRPPQDW